MGKEQACRRQCGDGPKLYPHHPLRCRGSTGTSEVQDSNCHYKISVRLPIQFLRELVLPPWRIIGSGRTYGSKPDPPKSLQSHALMSRQVPEAPLMQLSRMQHWTLSGPGQSGFGSATPPWLEQ